MAAKMKKQTSLDKAKKIINQKPAEFILGVIVLSTVFLSGSFLSFKIINSNKRIITNTKNKVKQNIKGAIDNKNSEAGIKYRVLEEGESIWDLAEAEYGSGYFFPTILHLNNFENPDLLDSGTKVRVR
jgi:nucleoid-associated protein YgaU